MRKVSDSEFERHIHNPELEYIQYRQCEPIEVTLNIGSLAHVGAMA